MYWKELLFGITLLAWVNCQVTCPSKLNDRYRINFSFPESCKKATCSYVAKIATNNEDPKLLDIIIEGAATGWISIGFSADGKMPDADVLACALNPSTGHVEILDTYNNGYTNIRDTIQNICPHYSNYSNGRISLYLHTITMKLHVPSFSRAINTGDIQDKNLNQPYHLLYGVSNRRNSVVRSNGDLKLSYHDTTPMISTSTYNPARDTVPQITTDTNLEETITSNEEYMAPWATSTMTINNINNIHVVKEPLILSNSATVWPTENPMPENQITPTTSAPLPEHSSTTTPTSEEMHTSALSRITNQTSLMLPIQTTSTANANYMPAAEQSVAVPITHEVDHSSGGSTLHYTLEYNTILSTTGTIFSDPIVSTIYASNPISLFSEMTLTPLTSHSSTPKSTTEVEPTADADLPSHHVPNMVLPEVNLSTSTTVNIHHPEDCPHYAFSDTNQQYKKMFPSNCSQETCDYYLSIQRNAESLHYLDFTLEAPVQGWIAIGFSSTAGMRDADVLACALHPVTKSVVILDTYNVATRYENVEDSNQNVCIHSTSFLNGRISCIFSRAIDTRDENDKDLSKEHYQLYGAVDNSPVVREQHLQLSYHNHQVPIVSDEAVNVLSEVVTSPFITSLPPLMISTSLPTTVTTLSSTSSIPSDCPKNSYTDAKYRLQFAIAPNCNDPGCGYFMMGIRTNDHDPKYLDFVIEGDARGWVAIGFSPNKGMPDADVLACALNPSTGHVEILDTYNNGYTNIRDTIQNICPHYSNYSNGRISCSFSRAINTGDVQDKDLNQPYHLLYGAVDAKPNTVKPNALLQLKYHGNQVPLVTALLINPAFHHETVNGSNAVTDTKHICVLSHGILMLVAWPVLATVAIFFASWMKPALPTGAWFQVHRGLMAGSLGVALCGFILIFIANKDGVQPGLISFSTRESASHFAIGILVMVLHIANPLISIFRCTPDAPRRWMFNIIHGNLVGVATYLLALSNVAIGIILFEKDQYHILWIYLTFLSFLAILLFILFVTFTVIAAKSKDAPKLGPPLLKPLFNRIKKPKDTSTGPSTTAMADMVSSTQTPEDPTPQQNQSKQGKLPSKDTPLRWTSLAILLVVMLPIVGTICIKIALTNTY